MLKLKVKIERVGSTASTETVAIANSGFIGVEPEILVPFHIVNQLKLHDVGEPEVYTKITGDGREVEFLKYRGAVKVYVITDDRVEGSVISTVLLSPRARYTLLNDKLLSKLKIALLDFGEGTWCFRDEIGEKERRSI